MRRLFKPFGLAFGLFASATFVQSCVADRATGANGLRLDASAAGVALPPVRISEIHYDNSGTDTGEAIEISGPAGTSLDGYSIVLYNGNGGASYDTDLLTGTIPATCGDRGVVVITYPANGIQNGAPDGIALVQGATVIEFLSYEGTFTAVGGAANGMVSTDIGVSQAGTEPIGSSIQRSGGNDWTPTAANTFGACNDADVPPPAVVASVTIEPVSATVLVGGNVPFTATARDASGDEVPGALLTWSSSATAVATVTSAGVATGVAEGDAQIVATAPNGASGSASLHVDPAPPPPPGGPVNIVELHYDNSGADSGEGVEIEGPAGMSVAGWQLVLYNGNGGAAYATTNLTGLFADQCGGRGTLHIATPGIQNGNPDGVALVSPSGLVEFLSYGGTFTATSGPANGVLSVDIGVSESGSTPAGRSLQKDAEGWYGPAVSSFGACNLRPPPPAPTVRIFGRDGDDPPVPVGFEIQLFAEQRSADNVVIPTTITWTSETPAIASVDNGIVTSRAAGAAVIRATATDGTTNTFTVPTRLGTAGGASYIGHTEFGVPIDANPSDDFIVDRAEFVSSFSQARGIPNWVSFNLEATHFGAEDRCDCFTYDPLVPFARYTTADYTGAGAFHGYGIDRGHLARSFDRTSGSLDNARTFYFSNIVPQAHDNNIGPWSDLEFLIGDMARVQNKEVYVIAGASGSKGTIKNEGKITIPSHMWKVAVVLPRDHGLANVDSWDDLEVIAAIMPNDPGTENVDWTVYRTTVDAVEALSGYDLLSLLPDQIEIAVESNTRPPVAVVNGPFTALPNESVPFSGAGSSDPDGDALSYAWSYGDGSTGTGLNAPHAYATPGTYTVTLTVTDTRGLVSVTTTTATVQSQSVPLMALKLQIDRNSLTVKLDAAIASIDRGDATPAIRQLNAFLNELDAMQQSGRIEAATAAAWRAIVNRVTQSLIG